MINEPNESSSNTYGQGESVLLPDSNLNHEQIKNSISEQEKNKKEKKHIH